MKRNGREGREWKGMEGRGENEREWKGGERSGWSYWAARHPARAASTKKWGLKPVGTDRLMSWQLNTILGTRSNY